MHVYQAIRLIRNLEIQLEDMCRNQVNNSFVLTTGGNIMTQGYRHLSRYLESRIHQSIKHFGALYPGKTIQFSVQLSRP